jgi:uncharacterized protein
MPGLRTVYQLQTIELERADVARKLHEAEQRLGETDALRGARERLQQEERGLSHLRGQLRNEELELQTLTSKIKETERRLYDGDVRNPKELESLQADIAFLRQRRDGLEDSILADLSAVDDADVRLEAATTTLGTTESSWQQDQTGVQTSVAALRSRLARLDEQTADLRAALPAALLLQYDETCRKKAGRGIAAVRAGLCEGCRVVVPTSLVQQVRRGDDVVRCNSCGRILWVE